MLRCLEKEPGQRFGSAAELEQAFAEWLEPPLPATGSATISRPTATPVVLALSFVLVGVAVAILLVASTRRPAGSIAREPAAPRPPDPAAASDPPVDVDPLARASPTPEPTPLRHPDPRVHRLLELVAEPDSGELAEAALLAAKLTIRPQLDVEAELRRLDRAAEGLRLQLANMRGTDRATALFQVVLRHVVRLAPQTSYGDPRNSCLDHVLESGEGIEITCALLLIALGERLDVPLQGACFPGSFMVLTPPPNSLVISFRNEQIELRTRVDAALVQRGQSTSLLDPAPRQLILVRLVHFMAQNLEAHGKRADARRAFELVQLLAPERTDAVIMRCYGGQ